MDPTTEPDLSTLVLTPIGVARSPFTERAEAPRQPRAAEGVRGSIELFSGRGYEHALEDLAGWEYIWVLFWFHKNQGWRPKVLPPRSERRRGLFATRTPHRPNPIGMSVLRLESVEGLTLRVANLDLLDGTPVLDIKPYVPWADAIPNARAGWLAEPVEAPRALGAPSGEPTDDAGVARPADPLPGYEVAFVGRAAEQLAYLRDAHAVALAPALAQALALGPHPHPYRRIRRLADGALRVALKEWRAHFRVAGRRIEVFEVRSGYRPAQLAGDEPALAAHRAFVARFGAAE